MKPFEDDAPIKTQWKVEEHEEITTVGTRQMRELGRYFSRKYLPLLLDDEIASKTFWRSSKAARARSSGVSLVEGINEGAGIEVIHPDGDVKYDIDADFYMRPWKIYKEAMDNIKSEGEKNPEWISKATEHLDLLMRILKPIGIQEKILAKPVKAMWTTTYVSCLEAVEAYWPQEEGQRTALTEFLSLIDPRDMEELRKISLWIWEKRFLDNDVYPLFGGLLTAEILERCLDESLRLNVYSAHDYTVLSVLSNLRIFPVYEVMMSFACTVTLEVWSSTPPPHANGPSR